VTDDLLEFILEVFKDWGNEVAGNLKATSSSESNAADELSFEIIAAIYEVFYEVFERYYLHHDHITEWVYELAGITDNTKMVVNNNHIAQLLNPIFIILMADPYLIHSRARSISMLYPAIPDPCTKMLSSLMKVLLCDMPPCDSYNFQLHIGKNTLPFGIESTPKYDDTIPSRLIGGSEPTSIIVSRFVADWLTSNIVPNLSSSEYLIALHHIKDCMNILSYEAMSLQRLELSLVLCHHCIRLIDVYSSELAPQDILKLHAYLLRLLRDVPASQYEFIIPGICDRIRTHVNDDAIRVRFITELVCNLVISPSDDGQCHEPSVLGDLVSKNKWMKSMLHLPYNSVEHSSSNHLSLLMFQSRFLAALCTMCTTILPVKTAMFIEKRDRVDGPYSTHRRGIGRWAAGVGSTLDTLPQYEQIALQYENKVVSVLGESEKCCRTSLVNLVGIIMLVLTHGMHCLSYTYKGVVSNVASVQYINLLVECCKHTTIDSNDDEELVLVKTNLLGAVKDVVRTYLSNSDFNSTNINDLTWLYFLKQLIPLIPCLSDASTSNHVYYDLIISFIKAKFKYLVSQRSGADKPKQSTTQLRKFGGAASTHDSGHIDMVTYYTTLSAVEGVLLVLELMYYQCNELATTLLTLIQQVIEDEVVNNPRYQYSFYPSSFMECLRVTKKKLSIPPTTTQRGIPVETLVECKLSHGCTALPNFSIYSSLMTTNTDTRYSGGREWITDERTVSTADIVALITDVITYHTNSLPAPPQQETDKDTTISRVVSGPLDMYWRTLSGSTDLVSVFATATTDTYHGNIEFVVRVTNTSGIKIPIFYVELLLDSYRNIGTGTECEQLESVVLKADASTCVLGDEYMPPNMSIIKKFQLKTSSLGYANLILRLNYHDIEYDAAKEFNLVNGSIDTENTEKYIECASVQCVPFHIGISAFLMPYGFGGLSAFQDSLLPGIPFQVFQAQVTRLRVHFSIPIESVLNVTSNVTSNVTDGMVALQKTNGNQGLFGVSMACKVRNNPNYTGDLTAWSFHTLWSDEIVVYINAFIETAARTKWKGSLVVCCNDDRVKQAVTADIDDFVNILSVGALQCV
jgi:hypothetical protein